MKKIIFTLTIISAFIAVSAVVNDPLSLPFQDWDQMPKDKQEMYINRSANMQLIAKIFGACFIIGASYLFIALIFGTQKQKKNK